MPGVWHQPGYRECRERLYLLSGGMARAVVLEQLKYVLPQDACVSPVDNMCAPCREGAGLEPLEERGDSSNVCLHGVDEKWCQAYRRPLCSLQTHWEKYGQDKSRKLLNQVQVYHSSPLHPSPAPALMGVQISLKHEECQSRSQTHTIRSTNFRQGCQEHTIGK